MTAQDDLTTAQVAGLFRVADRTVRHTFGNGVRRCCSCCWGLP